MRFREKVSRLIELGIRDTICKNSTANMCTTLGLAEVGSMCSHSSGCAIVKDSGLSASYTIAHELGHLLG